VSVSANKIPRRSWIGLRTKVWAGSLVAFAVGFAIYGPDEPKGITFSGPVTLTVIAIVIGRVGAALQRRADWRRWRALHGGALRSSAGRTDDGSDDMELPPSAAHKNQPGLFDIPDYVDERPLYAQPHAQVHYQDWHKPL
jgi:hypothetical protein